MPKGDSTFPFEVQLPDDLPDTFKCFKGAIAYKCAVLLQCDEKVSLMSNQISASLPFTIRSLVDVSQQRDANVSHFRNVF